MFHRLAKVLDGELARHRYVTGDALTAADLAISPPLSYSEMAGFPLEDYRAIKRWAEDMKSLAAWKKTVLLQQA
jgi:glutathione S-transferase